ncbi:MAG: LamG domain-containing protein [Firmicutes bacterium]|jgi:arabinan endo-1,5-alpha-L-arabinosidase|nr:LamG domain-containing protein [Bacillota bacterium]
MRRYVLVIWLLVLLVVCASGCAQNEVESGEAAAENGLVAHFAFEGNLADSTGNFAAGELIGTLIGPSVGSITDKRGEEYYSVSYGEGVKGQAIRFDGSQGVLLPGNLIKGYTYTISLWIKPEVFTTHTTTFFAGAGDTSWISIVPSSWSSGHTMLWSGNISWYDGLTGETIPLNEWTHVVVSVDSGSVKLYLNGVEKHSGTGFPDVFSTAGDGVYALAVNWWDPPFIGMLDELKIYDRALAPEHIK